MVESLEQIRTEDLFNYYQEQFRFHFAEPSPHFGYRVVSSCGEDISTDRVELDFIESASAARGIARQLNLGTMKL